MFTFFQVERSHYPFFAMLVELSSLAGEIWILFQRFIVGSLYNLFLIEPILQDDSAFRPPKLGKDHFAIGFGWKTWLPSESNEMKTISSLIFFPTLFTL
jgi:hypothetical protein